MTKHNDIKPSILGLPNDHHFAGHPVKTKNRQLMSHDFHWKGVHKYVVKYVLGCYQCLCIKTPRHKKYWKLQPLPVFEQPWSIISIDFIDQLPPSDGFDSILVFVDRLTKVAIFIPTIIWSLLKNCQT